MNIIELCKRIIMREKYNSETYIKYLRNKGISIGNNCVIFVPSKTLIDIQNPHMLNFGENVKIAEGVKILTHDFSWCVTSAIDGVITGSVGSVDIGSNVFIGMNAIIMRNVKIGNNVIIGAGSVVTKNCESGWVYAGVPAKKIMSIEEYHLKRKEEQIEDAINCVKRYYEKNGTYPEKKVLREFSFIFKENQEPDEIVQKLLLDSGHYEKCCNAYKQFKSQYNGYNEFLKKCEKNIKTKRSDEKMKVGILSMQRVDNFGSILQSYSLKKMLEDLGNEVYFIDIKECEEDKMLVNGIQNNFKDEKEGSNSIISKLSKIDRYAYNRFKIKKQNIKQNIEFENFRKEFLEIDKVFENEKLDYCVIGSDEVFNALANTSWGFTSQLFGNVENADKVITYAASCGATTYEKLPECVKNKVIKSFENVSAFSVRDENTRKFVKNLSNRDATLSLDPVVVGDFEREIIEYGKIKTKLKSKYCIIYSYYNRIHKVEEIKAIKEFCKNNKLIPVTIGAPQFWVKKHLILNPFEMLNVFKNAEFVITDTFHGSIFAAKYSKKFATLIRESNKNKLSDLLKRLNVDKHLLSNINELENIYKINNDISNIKDISKTERIRTIKYLEDNLIKGTENE